jgi:hypothetical protein
MNNHVYKTTYITLSKFKIWTIKASPVRSFGNPIKANIDNEIQWDEIIDFIDDDSPNGVKMAYHSELDKKGIDLIFIIMHSILYIERKEYWNIDY